MGYGEDESGGGGGGGGFVCSSKVPCVDSLRPAGVGGWVGGWGTASAAGGDARHWALPTLPPPPPVPPLPVCSAALFPSPPSHGAAARPRRPPTLTGMTRPSVHGRQLCSRALQGGRWATHQAPHERADGRQREADGALPQQQRSVGAICTTAPPRDASYRMYCTYVQYMASYLEQSPASHG